MTQGGSATFGERLHTYRLKAGLTQQELARGSGLSVRAVRNIERGEIGQPHQESVRRLAAGLGLSETERGQLAAHADERRLPALLRVELLGPLAAWRGDIRVDQSGGLPRRLLGALALRPGHTVSRDELIDLLWDDHPPRTAASALHVCVGQLRAVLEPGRAPRAAPEVVVRVHDGYRLELSDEQVDLTCFDHGAALALGQRGSAALDQYDQALGLWRGPVLADCGDRLRTHPAAVAAAGRRIAAVCAAADLALAEEQPARAVPWLRALLAEEPLHEGLHAWLILALSASGGRAEALGHYIRVRQALIDELGVEPGPELRAAHRTALGQDRGTAEATAAIVVPEAGADTEPHPGPVPRQLPSDVPAFTGRAAELADIDRRLTSFADGEEATTTAIFTVSGTAGVGKTALAVHWAHQVAKQFPDGQLFVNLRGYDPGQPMTAADALAGFLHALGVPGQDMPPEESDRAAHYRSLLAGKRMLVVLDNAGDAEQVRPLLPGGAPCVVVVTSRDSLAGLVARDGAQRIDLDLLPQKDAVGLLRALIGARVDADPEAAATLATRCSRLPLALRVAAELAAARPATPLNDLAGELADQGQRLDALEADGDPRTAVRAVFSWSYQHLGPAAARLFRLVALHPGPDLDSYAAAALTSSAVSQVRKLLDQLTRVNLIQPAGPGRYGLHDLLRAYAAEQAAEDGEEERRAALTRLFDYYLGTAAVAMDTVFPAERHRRPRVAPPAAPAPPVADRTMARTWLDEQRTALVAVAAYAAHHGWPGHATRLAGTLFRYLDSGGYYTEAITIHTSAQYAARCAGYSADEADALTNLGTINARMGHYRQSTDHHQQALAVFRELGDQRGQARALHNLGTVELLQARPQQASGYFHQALPRYRQAGDRTGEARTLNNLGTVDGLQSRYQQAAEHHQQALALSNQIGDRAGAALALTNLGSAYLEMGHYRLARDYQREALSVSLEVGDRTCQAHALVNLGHISVQQNRYQQAAEHHEQALDLFHKIGDLSGEAEAHSGLARAYSAIGNPGQARHHWQEALARYTECGAPQADQVRAELAAAGGQGYLES